MNFIDNCLIVWSCFKQDCQTFAGSLQKKYMYCFFLSFLKVNDEFLGFGLLVG